MTPTKDERRVGAPRKPMTLREAAIAYFEGRLEDDGHGLRIDAWPTEKYRDDPVLFAREVLGLYLTKQQADILEAARDHKRVAVASGHKVGKSLTAAIIALWYFVSYSDARVVMTSTTARQVDAILWRELRKFHTRSIKGIPRDEKWSIALDPTLTTQALDGSPKDLARSGLRVDFREVSGFTAKEAEAVAGISGAHLLYIVDEASGVNDMIFEAIQGNMVAGARIVMFSNPTRTEGEFFRAFHEKKQFYHTIQLSSEQSPNVLAGTVVVPGLAEREEIDMLRIMHGEDSPYFKIRVKGEFVLNEASKIISIHDITEAELRWADMPDDGQLVIGVDCAGPGTAGDQSVFVVRRGWKALSFLPLRGLTEDQIVGHILRLVAEHRRPREKPDVNIDCEGSIGWPIWLKVLHYSQGLPEHLAFAPHGIKCSQKATRQPNLYDNLRDELWANLAHWLRMGGAIPENVLLEQELHCPEWQAHATTAKVKCMPKPEMKRHLGRSPDLADALALAVWDAVSGLAVIAHERQERPAPIQDSRAAGMDPYAGLECWRPQ